LRTRRDLSRGRLLSSSEADFITGQVISPNGGETIVGI
jgi:hypothetical protein